MKEKILEKELIQISKVQDLVYFINEESLITKEHINSIKVFDLKKEEVIKRFVFEGSITYFNLSEDKEFILVSYIPLLDDLPPKLEVIDISTGQIKKVFIFKDYFQIKNIILDKNFEYLAFTNYGNIIVVNYITEEVIKDTFVDMQISDFDFNTDALLLITGDYKGFLKGWDLKSGEPLFEQFSFDLHNYEVVNGMTCFYLNSNFVLTTAQTCNIVYFYDTSSGNLTESKMGHNDYILFSNISYDKTKLITVSFEINDIKNDWSSNTEGYYQIKLWKISDEVCLWEKRIPSKVSNCFDMEYISISPENNKIAVVSKSKGLTIFDTISGKEINFPILIETIISPIFISNDRKIVSFFDQIQRILKFIDLEKNTIYKHNQLRKDLIIPSWEEAKGNYASFLYEQEKYELMELKTGNNIISVEVDRNIRSVCFTPGINHFVTIETYERHYGYSYNPESVFKLWDNSGKLIEELKMNYLVDQVEFVDLKPLLKIEPYLGLVPENDRYLLFLVNHQVIGFQHFPSFKGFTVMLFDLKEKIFHDANNYPEISEMDIIKLKNNGTFQLRKYTESNKQGDRFAIVSEWMPYKSSPIREIKIKNGNVDEFYLLRDRDILIYRESKYSGYWLNNIKILDFKENKILFSFPSRIAFKVSPDEKTLIVEKADDGYLIFDLDEMKEISSFYKIKKENNELIFLN